MLSALEELAREVGRDLLERSRQTADSMGVVWKGENDPVTLADRAAHEMASWGEENGCLAERPLDDPAAAKVT